MTFLQTQDVHWSKAFDAMCSSAHSTIVETAVGTQAYLAVSTSQVGIRSLALYLSSYTIACQWDIQLTF